MNSGNTEYKISSENEASDYIISEVGHIKVLHYSECDFFCTSDYKAGDYDWYSV